MLEVNEVLQLKEEYVLYKLEVEEGMYWLFNIENGDTFKLNETSYYMLSLFNKNRSIGEIEKCILEKYPDIESNNVLRDFEKLITNMKEQNIFHERR